MRRHITLMAVMLAAIALLASCGKEKGIYTQEAKYLPVVLQGSTKWSILNLENGEVLAKDAFVNPPSPVLDDMFWVYNDNNRIDFYNVKDCKKPVNKESYGSATYFNDGHAIVSRPGKPLEVINKQCETVAELSPSILTATMFTNGRSLIHTALDRYGFIDVKGDTVIKADYTNAFGFTEDKVALVSMSQATDSLRVISVIDRNGKKLCDLDTKTYQPMSDSYRMGALAVLKKDSLVYLDYNGKEVSSPLELPKKVKDANYRNGQYAGDGRYIVLKGDRWGLVDKDNNVLIPFKYQVIHNLSSTRYVVAQDSVMILVDDHGKQVGKSKFVNLRPYTPGSQAVRGYINVEVTAANLLSFIEDDMACFAKKGSTLMDLNSLVGVKPEQYVGMKQIDRPMIPLVYSYLFDREIASLGAAPAMTDSLRTDSVPSFQMPTDTTSSSSVTAHFNYDARLQEVHLMFSVLECAPGTEEQLCELMSRAMGSKGFRLNTDGTFTSEAGTGIAMGYEEGVFNLYYYFDAQAMQPLPRKSRTK